MQKFQKFSKTIRKFYQTSPKTFRMNPTSPDFTETISIINLIFIISMCRGPSAVGKFKIYRHVTKRVFTLWAEKLMSRLNISPLYPERRFRKGKLKIGKRENGPTRIQNAHMVLSRVHTQDKQFIYFKILFR